MMSDAAGDEAAALGNEHDSVELCIVDGSTAHVLVLKTDWNGVFGGTDDTIELEVYRDDKDTHVLTKTAKGPYEVIYSENNAVLRQSQANKHTTEASESRGTPIAAFDGREDTEEERGKAEVDRAVGDEDSGINDSGEEKMVSSATIALQASKDNTSSHSMPPSETRIVEIASTPLAQELSKNLANSPFIKEWINDIRLNDFVSPALVEELKKGLGLQEIADSAGLDDEINELLRHLVMNMSTNEKPNSSNSIKETQPSQMQYPVACTSAINTMESYDSLSTYTIESYDSMSTNGMEAVDDRERGSDKIGHKGEINEVRALLARIPKKDKDQTGATAKGHEKLPPVWEATESASEIQPIETDMNPNAGNDAVEVYMDDNCNHVLSQTMDQRDEREELPLAMKVEPNLSKKMQKVFQIKEVKHQTPPSVSGDHAKKHGVSILHGNNQAHQHEEVVPATQKTVEQAPHLSTETKKVQRTTGPKHKPESKKVRWNAELRNILTSSVLGSNPSGEIERSEMNRDKGIVIEADRKSIAQGKDESNEVQQSPERNLRVEKDEEDSITADVQEKKLQRSPLIRELLQKPAETANSNSPIKEARGDEERGSNDAVESICRDANFVPDLIQIVDQKNQNEDLLHTKKHAFSIVSNLSKRIRRRKANKQSKKDNKKLKALEADFRKDLRQALALLKVSEKAVAMVSSAKIALQASKYYTSYRMALAEIRLVEIASPSLAQKLSGKPLFLGELANSVVINEWIDGLLRFLAMRLLISAVPTPNDNVHDAWRALVLHPTAYASVCKALGRSEAIELTNCKSSSIEMEWHRYTYEVIYNVEPPLAFWCEDDISTQQEGGKQEEGLGCRMDVDDTFVFLAQVVANTALSADQLAQEFRPIIAAFSGLVDEISRAPSKLGAEASRVSQDTLGQIRNTLKELNVASKEFHDKQARPAVAALSGSTSRVVKESKKAGDDTLASLREKSVKHVVDETSRASDETLGACTDWTVKSAFETKRIGDETLMALATSTSPFGGRAGGESIAALTTNTTQFMQKSKRNSDETMTALRESSSVLDAKSDETMEASATKTSLFADKAKRANSDASIASLTTNTGQFMQKSKSTSDETVTSLSKSARKLAKETKKTNGCNLLYLHTLGVIRLADGINDLYDSIIGEESTPMTPHTYDDYGSINRSRSDTSSEATPITVYRRDSYDDECTFTDEYRYVLYDRVTGEATPTTLGKRESHDNEEPTFGDSYDEEYRSINTCSHGNRSRGNRSRNSIDEYRSISDRPRGNRSRGNRSRGNRSRG